MRPLTTYRGVPTLALVRMFFGVFLLFAPTMLLATSHYEPKRDPLTLLFWGVVSGLVGVGYALAATINRRLFLVVIPYHVAALWCFTNKWPARFSVGHPASGIDALATIGCLAGGYALLIRFSRAQGVRAAKLQTELDLAATIHKTLVPDIHLSTPALTIRGISKASSSMGGDLIDLVQRPGETDVFLADVSGHGVGAGIVMGMVKSAIRMRLRAAAPLATLVSDLNAVLSDLTDPNMFATFACLRFKAGGEAQYALAGHLPILHYSAATRAVNELPNEALPLGVTADESFHAGSLRLGPGDTLALFTDGLSEVMDAGGRQLGLDAIRGLFATHQAQPLDKLHEAIMACVRAHGPQQDDQTLLLIRVT